MEQFATEEQQVEAIKRFWKDNGLAIIAGAVIGLGGLWGWRYFTEQQLVSKEEASIEYQAAVEAAIDEKSTEKLIAFTDQTDQPGYKAISELILATQHVEKRDYDAASDVLENLIVSEKDSPLAAVASLRLGALQLEQSQYEAAISTAENIKIESFQAQSLVLKGDALTALSRFEEAKAAYELALEKSPNDTSVQMKLDNVAVKVGA